MPHGADEDVLLGLLNSTPVVDGVRVDELADPAVAKRWLRDHGGCGSDAELEQVIAARDALQAVVRGQAPPESLARLLGGVRRAPKAGPHGIAWTLEGESVEDLLPARLVLTWGELSSARPGRLRACANHECALFLLDRSNGNRAQWCSMASCGNRMKARRYYDRRHLKE